METNFDFNIDNYTLTDLFKLFKLEHGFSIKDLLTNGENLTKEILSKIDPKYKNEIINFIKLGKGILTTFQSEMESNKELKTKIDNFLNKDYDSRLGKIINPLATRPALEDTRILKENINGYDYNTTTSVYVFNTAARNDFFTSYSEASTFDLPVKLSNVISISLSTLTIPNVMYTFSEDRGNNQIYIEEDGTDCSGIVTLPDGNYTPFSTALALLTESSFPIALTKSINLQLGTGDRFKVGIDLASRATNISNTTNTFTMTTIHRHPKKFTSKHNYNAKNRQLRNIIHPAIETPPKESLPVLVYIKTLGYAMGFREIKYQGKNSYTSENLFDNRSTDYLYFVLEDYTGSRTFTETYGMLGVDGILKGSILGVIPINTNFFGTAFDNGSNFIYKKREYNGPVDISRITIKLLDQTGDIADLHNTNFNFSLQVKSIYNLNEKGKIGLRNPGLI
jgi:hypothetical protein